MAFGKAPHFPECCNLARQEIALGVCSTFPARQKRKEALAIIRPGPVKELEGHGACVPRNWVRAVPLGEGEGSAEFLNLHTSPRPLPDPSPDSHSHFRWLQAAHCCL